MSNFHSRRLVPKREVIASWENDIIRGRNLDKHDAFDEDHLDRHRSRNDLGYYIVTLTEAALSNIVVPYHNHPPIHASPGGEALLEIVPRCQEHPDSDCSKRIRDLMEVFFRQCDTSQEPLSAGCMLVYGAFICSQRQWSKHEYRNHGGVKLYAASFHRFAAYGLWVRENGYKPIQLYYCTLHSTRA